VIVKLREDKVMTERVQGGEEGEVVEVDICRSCWMSECRCHASHIGFRHSDR
jgi:hypothetical protein